MDVLTLFYANAVVMLVMAASFLAAWMRQQEQGYWLSWALSCVVMTAAFLSFPIFRQLDHGTALPQALLVLGFGFRWRATLQFTGHDRSDRAGLLWVLAPTILMLFLWVVPQITSDRSVYLIANLILTCQAAAIAWHFYDRCDDLGASRWGLIFAYAIVAVSFSVCLGQGFWAVGVFEAMLKQDPLMSIHLFVALIHTTASGAFALAIAYNRAESHLRREHAMAEDRARSMSRMAERDALTGLMNRRAVESRFAGLQREGFVTVAVLDLDHFKDINDRFGHAIGDAVLRASAEALGPDEDCLAVRLGGEEFMLILRAEGAREKAERRRQAIEDRVAEAVPELDRPVTASMGVVELRLCETSIVPFSEFYIAADRLLYQAKEAGRNGVRYGSLVMGKDGEMVAVPTPQCLTGEMEEPCAPMLEGRLGKLAYADKDPSASVVSTEKGLEPVL